MKKRLYQFMKTEYVKSAILNGIFAPLISEVNDPYEFEGIKYADKYHICSLTSTNNSMLMWSYYADKHRGCCVYYEFDDKDIKKIVKKVKYVKNFVDRRYLGNKDIEKSLFCKGKEWKHELEYRILFSKDDYDDSLWNVKNKCVYFKARVKEVILGYLSDGLYGTTGNVLKDIYDYNIKYCDKKIKVSKMIINSNKYMLVKDKQYDYLMEINGFNLQ